jgi:hypothetical protein
MPDKKQDLIDQRLQDLNNDGVDRRGFLKWYKKSIPLQMEYGLETLVLTG